MRAIGSTAALACLGGLTALPTQAGDLRLQPVVINLPHGESSTTVAITNLGAGPITLTSRAFVWRQQDGEEALGPTTDIAVSPARVQVPPGGQQRLRVVLRTPPADEREHSYRLIVDETAPTPGAATTRYSLPMFVQAATSQAPAQLGLRLSSLGPRSTQLRIDNPGAQHARLVNLAHRTATGETRMLAPDLAGYVLPGSHKHWVLPGPIEHYRTGRFEATVNGRPMAMSPQPEPRPPSDAP